MTPLRDFLSAAERVKARHGYAALRDVLRAAVGVEFVHDVRPEKRAAAIAALHAANELGPRSQWSAGTVPARNAGRPYFARGGS